MNRQFLFSSNSSLSELFARHERAIAEAIDAITPQQLLASTDQQIVDHIATRFTLAPLELREDATAMEQREIKISVEGDPRYGRRFDGGPVLIPGVEVRVSIPFSGNESLFYLRPSQGFFSGRHLLAEIQTSRNEQSSVVLIFQHANDWPHEKLKTEVESGLKSLRTYCEWSTADVNGFNAGLPSKIKLLIEPRKARLNQNLGIQRLLGIPLKRKDGAPTLEPIRLERKVAPLATPSTKTTKQEYGISENDYEFILKIVRHEVRTFEATPVTFHKLHEEDLRNVLLAHLNGHFEGGATGETFRRSGKTDIHIQFESRSAFVGECKVWRGVSEVADAINQLLGYLTWRDSKAALIIFDKDIANFTEILTKAPTAFTSHPRYRRTAQCSSHEGEWRFVMSSLEDDSRLVTVHLFLANIFQPKGQK